MNSENFAISQEDLDRLVEGELDRGAYQDLLCRLDRAPDGWRRCALAFLEAQAWSQTLSVWSAEKEAEVSRPTQTSLQSSSSGASLSTGHWNWTWALATSAVLFVVGWIGGGRYGSLFSNGTREVAMERQVPTAPDRMRPADDAPVVPAIASTLHNERRVDSRDVRGSARSPDSFVVTSASPVQDGTWMLPVYHYRDPSAQRILRNEGILDDAAVRKLQQSGLVVQRERRFTPVTLQDGTPGIVPWEAIEIRPATHAWVQ